MKKIKATVVLKHTPFANFTVNITVPGDGWEGNIKYLFDRERYS